MQSFSSIILRFRDLSNPAGTTTIGEHKRIIGDKGYVWWGWWHKQGETVPEDAFREILAKIGNSGPYKIFLFDTGKYELHQASLVDIKWDPKLILIATPDRASKLCDLQWSQVELATGRCMCAVRRTAPPACIRCGARNCARCAVCSASVGHHRMCSSPSAAVR
jgi:hypothetical protein